MDDFHFKSLMEKAKERQRRVEAEIEQDRCVKNELNITWSLLVNHSPEIATEFYFVFYMG